MDVSQIAKRKKQRCWLGCRGSGRAVAWLDFLLDVLLLLSLSLRGLVLLLLLSHALLLCLMGGDVTLVLLVGRGLFHRLLQLLYVLLALPPFVVGGVLLALCGFLALLLLLLFELLQVGGALVALPFPVEGGDPMIFDVPLCVEFLL
jgi:hypothetical protein